MLFPIEMSVFIKVLENFNKRHLCIAEKLTAV